MASIERLDEVRDVLARPRFERYVSAEERVRFLASLVARVVLVTPAVRVEVCRDPKDDVFLSVALAGGADVIVSGDLDLFTLDPFHGVRILTPAAFLGADAPVP